MDAHTPAFTQTDGAYRDATETLRARWQRQRAEIERTMTGAEFRAVLAARLARTVFGATLALGFVLMVGTSLYDATNRPNSFSYVRETRSVALVLAGTWAAAIALGLITRVAASAFAPKLLGRSLGRLLDTEDLRADHAHWQEDAAIEKVLRGAFADGAWGASLPLVGLSLMAPLGIHATYLALKGDGLAQVSEWIGVSLVIVGHCHLVLAALGWRHGRQLMRVPKLGQSGLGDGFKALGWTIVASLFPGVLLILVPPGLVAITGLAFVPWAWWWVTSRSYHERDTLRALTFSSLGFDPDHAC